MTTRAHLFMVVSFLPTVEDYALNVKTGGWNCNIYFCCWFEILFALKLRCRFWVD